MLNSLMLPINPNLHGIHVFFVIFKSFDFHNKVIVLKAFIKKSLEEVYEALREYCFKKRLKHSPIDRHLIVDKLKKEGVIKKGDRRN